MDIAKVLGLPRTTVWKAVRRLESSGYVEVIKVGGKNFVRLRNTRSR